MQNSNVTNLQTGTKAKMVDVASIFGDKFGTDYKVLTYVSDRPSPSPLNYIPDTEVFETILRWFSAKPISPLGINGPTGSGKSEICEYLCSMLNVPFYKLQCHPDLRADTLFLKDAVVVENGASKTIAEMSPLLKAYKDGGLIVLDEFDKLNSECTAALHALTEYKSIHTEIGEIKPSHLTKIMGTSNTVGDGCSADYSSSLELDMAFRVRWNMLHLSYPPAEVEVDILRLKFPKQDVELLKNLVSVAGNLRTAKENDTLTVPFSPRSSVSWVNNIGLLGPKKSLLNSFSMTYINGLENDEKNSALDVLETVFTKEEINGPVSNLLNLAPAQ